MEILPVGMITSEPEPVAGIARETGAAPADFGKWIAEQVNGVNEKLNASEIAAQRLAAGEPLPLHQVMLQMEEARLSFQLLAQVRNRLLEAYQDVMRMQV